MTHRKKIALVFFDAGGGHRSAAVALQEAIRDLALPWQVELVHLFEVLDPGRRFEKLSGMRPEDYYNKRLARGWTAGLAQELKVLQAMIRLAHPMLVRSLQQHWLRSEPDLVVSLIPNFNRALYQSLTTTLPGVPFVTLLTDLADHPPNFWIEPGQPQHLICGTPFAVEQALEAGFAPERVFRTSGMVLRAGFYAPGIADREQEARALGLDPTRPIGIVMCSGHGPAQMSRLAARLADTQLIFLCGRNAALVDKLSRASPQARHVAVGYTHDVPRYMSLGEFFIGKPGPGSLSEAVHMGLPVITIGNRWTMPQERHNVDWVRDNGYGIVLKSFAGIQAAVAEMVRKLPAFKARVGAHHNRAVFEIPPMLAHVMAGSHEAVSPIDVSLVNP